MVNYRGILIHGYCNFSRFKWKSSISDAGLRLLATEYAGSRSHFFYLRFEFPRFFASFGLGCRLAFFNASGHGYYKLKAGISVLHY